MEDGVSKLISELTRVISELGDRKTGDAKSEESAGGRVVGMLGNAFKKSKKQEKSEQILYCTHFTH